MEYDEKIKRIDESLLVIKNHSDDQDYKDFIDKLLASNSNLDTPLNDMEQLVYLQEKETLKLSKKTSK